MDIDWQLFTTITAAIVAGKVITTVIGAMFSNASDASMRFEKTKFMMDQFLLELRDMGGHLAEIESMVAGILVEIEPAPDLTPSLKELKDD